jgi:two-component system sensor histidine kinase KdpD
VVDQGPGVPPEALELMFEPFQRLGDGGAAGLGLGLAVARGLTEALGGTLSAEDTPGGGLTMVVSLPRAHTGSDARAEAS